MNNIKILEKLEPLFKQAAGLAVKMQGTAKQRNKTNTGWDVADIVTEADLAVQEFLLNEIIKTDLVDCRLLAEEDTPLTDKFNPNGKFYLAIDPIDGTAIYAKAGKHFSVIVSLHDGKNLLYTFKYFPLLNWAWKIVLNKSVILGRRPVFNLPDEAKNKIIYYSGNPKKFLPSELFTKLTGQGLEFARVDSLSKNLSGSAMFVAGEVAGYYTDDPNVYDGLVSLHYAQTQNFKIYSGGPNGKLDFRNIKKRETGLYYPGYYLVLN